MMKGKKSILAIVFMMMIGFSFSQNMLSDGQTQEETETLVKSYLQEIFNDYYDDFAGHKEQVDFFVSYYKKMELLSIDEAPENIMNLSDLQVMDKYNPEVIQHDNISAFNPETFNPLKYIHDFDNKVDLYYQIYDTDKVLKINK